jgi:hypothetical protein
MSESLPEDARSQKTYQRLQRLLISTQDFQIAGSAATFLLEDVDETKTRYSLEELRRLRCYETTMVVAYARPFSMAKGTVGPLSLKDVSLKKSDPFFALHQKLIEHRNTLYGHSDAEHVEMRVWSMQPFSDRKDINLIMPRFDEGMRFSDDEIDLIHQKLREFVHVLLLSSQKLGLPYKDQFHKVPDD